MKLDRAQRVFLKEFKAICEKNAKASLAKQRKASKEFFSKAPTVEVAKVKNVRAEGPFRKVPIRLYYPESKPLPLIVFFHGGGFVFGSIDASDSFCRKLAKSTKCTVASVDYALAPEHKFPDNLAECFMAIEWLLRNGLKLGIDSQKVAVAGASAGANLAAACAIMAKNSPIKFFCQLLLYPTLTNEFHKKDFEVDKVFITYERMFWFWDCYLVSKEDANNPTACPLKAKSVKELPPAIIVTGEYDPLRNDAVRFAKKLKDAKILDFPKVIHGFLEIPFVRKANDQALKEIGKALEKYKL